MRCHPLLAGVTIPQDAALGPYRLQVLGPDYVKEDYDAVIESRNRLKGMMGGSWPEGLTLEENHIDLCWHLREFEHNRSFAWIIRDAAQAYLGCAYVFPDFSGNGASVSIWMRSSCGPNEHEKLFSGFLLDWLNGPDWPDFTYRLTLPKD